MKTNKFSEWVSTSHPEFSVEEGFWDGESKASDRLGTMVGHDRRKMRANPMPRPISKDLGIQGVAEEFIEKVKSAVESNALDNIAVDDAAEASASVGGLSRDAAKRLFYAAAFWNESMALATVSKILMSMTTAGKSIRPMRPGLDKDVRQTHATVTSKEITQDDRLKIEKMIAVFLHKLVGQGSAPAATLPARA